MFVLVTVFLFLWLKSRLYSPQLNPILICFSQGTLTLMAVAEKGDVPLSPTPHPLYAPGKEKHWGRGRGSGGWEGVGNRLPQKSGSGGGFSVPLQKRIRIQAPLSRSPAETSTASSSALELPVSH